MPDAPPPLSSGPHAWLLAAARREYGAHKGRLPEVLPIDVNAAWDAVLATAGITARQLATAAAAELRVRPVQQLEPDAAATRLVPEALARRYGALPVLVNDDTMLVATVDPLNLEVEHNLGFVTGRRIELSPMAPSELGQALNLAYAPERAVDAVADSLGSDVSGVRIEEDLVAPTSDFEDPTGAVRRLAASLLRDAVLNGASDIHLAPSGTQGAVRYRLDGIMKQVLAMPLPVYLRVVSRLKVIGGLDISDTRRPQDGRSRIVVDGRGIDLRISSLPLEVGGERLVLRLLLHDAIQSLEALDLIEPERTQLLQLMDLADGLVLMTGPTGSGKTTTLHAALQRRLSPEVTIMTVENPVEYRIDGISQVQVDPKAGLTFASALRAMLRQDPDIVLVGEIRDNETAVTAAQAAMTGHLVLSTVHSEDAPGALVRLRDLGIPLDTLTETFKGAVAQRLLRKLCAECRVPGPSAELSEHDRRFLSHRGYTIGAHSDGCEKCGYTGYAGRLPIHQVFTMTDAVRPLLLAGGDPTEVRRVARGDGMRSLGESAAARVIAGETTVDEVFRVLGRRLWDDIAEAMDPLPDAAHSTPLAVAAEMDVDETLPLQSIDLRQIDAARERRTQEAIVAYSPDTELADRLQRACAQSGLTVFSCTTPRDLARVTREAVGIRLLVVDVSRSLDAAGSGAGSLRTLRRALGGLTLPVIAVGESFDQLTATTASMLVDDAVPLPLDEALLAKRVAAALQRSAQPS